MLEYHTDLVWDVQKTGENSLTHSPALLVQLQKLGHTLQDSGDTLHVSIVILEIYYD